MIIATPLDLPKIEPDDWNIFWNIWKSNLGPVLKTKKTSNISKAKIGVDKLWSGLDIYKNYDLETSWSCPFYDISNELPNMYLAIKNLPIKNLYKVRVIHSLKDIVPHSDDNFHKWTVRYLLHCTDSKSQLYFTKPENNDIEKRYMILPKETNWFAYNDKFCWHGSDYNLNHPKFLIQIFSFDNYISIANSSIEKFKNFTITL